MTSPDQPGSAPPPSLFAGAPAAGASPATPGAATDDLRMLAGLDLPSSDPDSRSARAWKKPALAVLAGVLVIGAVGWWQLDRDAAAGEFARMSAVAASGPIAALAAAARETGPAAAAGSVSAASAAAPASPAAASAATPMGATTASIEKTDMPLDVAERASPAASSVLAASVAATAASGLSPSRSTARTASSSRLAAAHRGAPVRTAGKSTSDPAKKPTGTSGGDSDVELLTAMVAHLEGKDRESKERLVRALARPGPAREPIQASTIDRLVHSCKQFAGTEQEHCRRQICEGNWGRAPSCPARLAPDRAVSKR